MVIAVKGPALTAAVARSIAPLLGPQTIVLPAMNGVPWWFCARRAGASAARRSHSVDPGGAIAAAIPFERVLGCVVHASTSAPEPGLVQHKMGQGLIVGEPRGGRSERAQRVVDLLAHAGFDADACRERALRRLVQAVGQPDDEPGQRDHRRDHRPHPRRPAGARLLFGRDARGRGDRRAHRLRDRAVARRIATRSPRKLGAFKTSMLQDVEAGRAIELDAIVAAVHEIGQPPRRADAEHRRAARPDAPVRPRARAVPGGLSLRRACGRINRRLLTRRAACAAWTGRGDQLVSRASAQAMRHGALLLLLLPAASGCGGAVAAVTTDLRTRLEIDGPAQVDTGTTSALLTGTGFLPPGSSLPRRLFGHPAATGVR